MLSVHSPSILSFPAFCGPKKRAFLSFGQHRHGYFDLFRLLLEFHEIQHQAAVSAARL
jgi:hypothetical protein